MHSRSSRSSRPSWLRLLLETRARARSFWAFSGARRRCGPCCFDSYTTSTQHQRKVQYGGVWGTVLGTVPWYSTRYCTGHMTGHMAGHRAWVHDRGTRQDPDWGPAAGHTSWVQYCILHGSVLCCAVQDGTVRYGTVRYGIVQEPSTWLRLSAPRVCCARPSTSASLTSGVYESCAFEHVCLVEMCAGMRVVDDETITDEPVYAHVQTCVLQILELGAIRDVRALEHPGACV